MDDIKELVKELGKLAKRSHFWVDEDNWYSCPKAPDGCLNDAAGTECNCGADEHNAEVDKLVNKISLLLIVKKWSKVLEPDFSSKTTCILIESQKKWTI